MKFSKITNLYDKFSLAIETEQGFNFASYLDLTSKESVINFLRALEDYSMESQFNDDLRGLHEGWEDLVGEFFDQCLSHWKSDREVMIAFCELGIRDYRFEKVGEDLKADYEFMITAIYNYFSPEHASMKLRANKAFMLEVIAYHGLDIMFASPELKDDEEFVLKALSKSGQAVFEYISDRLKLSEEFILKAIQIDIKILVNIDDSQFSNSFKEQVAIFKNKQLKNFEKCFKKDPNFLMYYGDPFRNPGICFGGNDFLKVIGFKMNFYKAMYAVRKNGALLNYLDDSLRDNPKIIDAALNENKHAIKFVSEKKLKLKKYAKYLSYLDEEHEFDDIPF